MNRRPGLSLTEVLVALFLMAIGVIGVLTMFPVGAVQMGTALKDQRCAEGATQADAYMRWYWRHYIVETGGKGPDGNTEDLWTQLEANATTNPNGPSYPVVVDPMGYQLAGTNPFANVANIPRVSLRLILSTTPTSGIDSLAIRTCTLLDGFGYDAGGTGEPAVVNGNLDREHRYNWLWIIQRPNNSQKYNANMTVVLFNQRKFKFPAMSIQEPTPVGSSGTPSLGDTTVSLSGSLANLQKGTWVTDVSTQNGVQLCNSYRVVGVTGSPPSIDLNTPMRAPLGGSSYSSAASFTCMYGVAEVFDRAPLNQDNPAP